MGLRINTNISAVTALRTLKINERSQATSLERLSTGLRINRASDDPSGLVISEIIRAQLVGLKQAVENSQNASNLVSVADAALGNISDLLVGINESIIFALNTGGTSPDQIEAEQQQPGAAGFQVETQSEGGRKMKSAKKGKRDEKSSLLAAASADEHV